MKKIRNCVVLVVYCFMFFVAEVTEKILNMLESIEDECPVCRKNKMIVVWRMCDGCRWEKQSTFKRGPQ